MPQIFILTSPCRRRAHPGQYLQVLWTQTCSSDWPGGGAKSGGFRSKLLLPHLVESLHALSMNKELHSPSGPSSSSARQSPLPLFGFQKIPALTRQEEKQIQRLPLAKEEFGGGKAQGKAALWCFAHTTSHTSGKCSNPPVLHPDCSVEREGGTRPGRGCLGHV